MNDGGPAYPNRGDNTPTHDCYDGMSRLDYFAGEAMKGMLGNPTLMLSAAEVAKQRSITIMDSNAICAVEQARALLRVLDILPVDTDGEAEPKRTE